MGALQNVLPILLQQIMQRNAQRPMSEQPPGGNQQPFGLPGMPQGGQQQMPTPQMSPQQQQLQQRMQNAGQIFNSQPNATASASGPPQYSRPMRPGEMGQTEWDTKGGRAMAITGAAVESFGNAFQQGQQKNWQSEASRAEQTWQSYMGLTQALSEAQDPKAKQAIQQQIDTLLQDKKTQQMMKKAHSDPTSPQGVGLQRAMQQSKAEAKQQADLEEMYSKIQEQQSRAQAEQARAQQEQATAHLRDVQAAQEGQITPKVAAEMQNKRDMTQAQVEQQQQHWKTWADVENRRTDEMLQAARIRASSMKNAKGNDQAIKYFQLQYGGLEKQFSDVNRQIKDVNDNIGKTSFWRRGHLKTLNEKLVPLQQRSDQLRQSMESMNQRLSQATAAGAIQMPEPPSGDSGTPSVSPPPNAQIVDFSQQQP